MPRAKGQTARSTVAVEKLETALVIFAQHVDTCKVIKIRIEQAMKRARLDALLSPALSSVQRMLNDFDEAIDCVNAAIAQMKE